MKNNDLGLVLLMGVALFYVSRRNTAYAAGVRRAPLGTGSMPGSAGTGLSQIMGGIAGAFRSLANTPVTQYVPGAATVPSAIDDAALQNDVYAANNPDLSSMGNDYAMLDGSF